MARTPEVRTLRARRLAQLDDLFEWLPFDSAGSRGYGEVAGGAFALGFTGARLRGKDALLAGQALSLGAAVMTANRADFAPFEDSVQVLSPTWRSR